MKKAALFLTLCLFAGLSVFAQVGINSDNSAPDPSAGLDVKFTNKGLLPPRMTAARIATIVNPADGLLVYCTTDNKMYVFNAAAGQWKEMSYGVGSIAPLPLCGTNFTVNHVAGTVAPVTKTVIYGSVTNIPGEPAKCWITCNLGADHQAAAVSDETEGSAGWYWQFNRKQGYKHTGSALTPAWTINSMNEDYDWLTTNDPCNLLLGPAWRIPSYTEWFNVDNAGGWITWTDTWNSNLKLHAAGFLDYDEGALYFRGLNGKYWCSTQYNSTGGWALIFGSGTCDVDDFYKPYGLPVRCLRDQ